MDVYDKPVDASKAHDNVSSIKVLSCMRKFINKKWEIIYRVICTFLDPVKLLL